MILHPLRKRRRERRMTQYDLGLVTGVAQVSISYAERGYPTLNPEQKAKIAAFLGSTVEELFPKELELPKASKK